ncbi:hypothetical protein JEZ13_11390 [bacterium]|nr:hypothetical protein [bacterium]MBI9073750.1 hypothetical protein [Melioribacteraceae bacterium]
MVIKVKNLVGTGSNAREITGTWLEYWEEQTGRKAEKCCAYDENLTKDRSKVYLCGSTKGLLGGHVKKVKDNDNRWYILPICSSHNKTDDEYWAKKEDLVLATKE